MRQMLLKYHKLNHIYKSSYVVASLCCHWPFQPDAVLSSWRKSVVANNCLSQSQVHAGGAEFRSMASQFVSGCRCLVYFCPCNTTWASLRCLSYQALDLFGPARSASPGARIKALQPRLKYLKH